MMSRGRALFRGCLSKSRYSDEPLARAHAMHMLEAGLVTGEKAWVYRCGECAGWHITTRAGGNHLSAWVRADNAWVPSEFAQ